MIQFDSRYLKCDEIAYMTKGASGRDEYPYRITVRMKDGTGFSTDYVSEMHRDNDLRRLIKSIEYHEKQTLPVSQATTKLLIQMEISREVAKVRRDIKALRKGLEGKGHE